MLFWELDFWADICFIIAKTKDKQAKGHIPDPGKKTNFFCAIYYGNSNFTLQWKLEPSPRLKPPEKSGTGKLLVWFGFISFGLVCWFYVKLPIFKARHITDRQVEVMTELRETAMISEYYLPSNQKNCQVSTLKKEMNLW